MTDERAGNDRDRGRDDAERDDRGVYIISVAAELAGVHPQTLRIYERKGLLRPARTAGNTRRYSERDIERLRAIHELTHKRGVNLAGVKMIVEMENQLERMRRQTERLDRELDRARDRAREEVLRLRGQRGEILPLSAVRELQALFEGDRPAKREPARRGPIAVGPIRATAEEDVRSKR
jgi:MerR family transcriptional regulator, heat shock protein HspR